MTLAVDTAPLFIDTHTPQVVTPPAQDPVTVTVLLELTVDRRTWAAGPAVPDNEVALAVAAFLAGRVRDGAAYLIDQPVARITLVDQSAGTHAIPEEQHPMSAAS